MGTIQRANLDGSQVETIISGLDDPQGIALDVDGSKIYWTESERVGRANLDGSQIQTLGTTTGGDLDLDVAQGKIYLANWHGVIYRTGLSGSPVEILVSNAGSSEVIALDLIRGKMYWAGWRGSTLKWANLDGSEVETIVSGLDRVHDIDIDEGGGKIYWTGWDGVLRANLDGSQVETLFTETSEGVAVDGGGGKIYWTEKDRVRRANLDGSEVETIVSGLDDAEDIALSP